MSADERPGFHEPRTISLGDLDLSVLVARELALFSDQYPGREMRVRVLSVQDNQLLVDGPKAGNLFESLVDQQVVVVQFTYKGELVGTRAKVRKGTGNRCSIILEGTIAPLTQRRFRRICLERPVRLAPFPMTTYARRNFSRLRWIDCRMVNFSSGGMLVEMGSMLDLQMFVLVHAAVGYAPFPPLILAQVKHLGGARSGRFMAGLEFVTAERSRTEIPTTTRQELPEVVFSYHTRDREHLNRRLQAWTPTETEHSDTR